MYKVQNWTMGIDHPFLAYLTYPTDFNQNIFLQGPYSHLIEIGAQRHVLLIRRHIEFHRLT